MNLFNSAITSLFNSPQKRSLGLNSQWPFLSFMSASTTSGAKINSESSLKISAFWCGVNTIANSLALLPKHVMQKTDKKREPLPNHAVDYLIHNEPNTYMTAFSFWFAFAVCMLLKGNGFARIVRNGGGKIISLNLWHPDDVKISEYDGQLFYKYKNEEKLYFASEVFHVPAFSVNGITGRSALQYAADNLGVSLAADDFAAAAYSDKGISYGILETDKNLNTNGKDQINKIFNQSLDTNDKHKLAVFDEGMKYKRISLTPAEAEFIQAKATGVEDIARWLSVPLHKLHTSGEGGYNFLVQMSIEYLQSAVLPLGQKIKEESQRKLLSTAEKKNGLYVFMNYKKLLEVDPKSRAQFYKDMIYIKAMNPNEVRSLEDMNPYVGGDEFLQMTNLQTQEQIKEQLADA